MPSTTALFSALSGLNANARNIDVIGNNIANINTTAFKSSRLMFSSIFSRTTSGGTPPQETTGGTNPFQIGFGVNVAGTQRNFNNGPVNATGDSRDLAIEGDGFFIVNRGTETLYTRAGAFRQNSENDLTNISGERLQGYGIDENYNIIPGALVDINIPLGGLPLALATQNVSLSGNINGNGDLPSAGSSVQIGTSATGGFRTITTAVPAPTPGNLVETTTRLVDLEDPSLPASDTPLFAAGQTIQLNGAQKGNKSIPNSDFLISATSTLGDLAAFLSLSMGISTATGNNPDGGVPGVSVDPATGRLSIVGNTGVRNDIDLDTEDLRLLDANGTLVRTPFSASKIADADGESVRTTFVAFDSLGSTVELDTTLVLESRTSVSTTWRYYVETAGDANGGIQNSTGTLTFDTNGRLLTTDPIAVSINRVNQGVTTPMNFTLRFDDELSTTTSLAAEESVINASFRDGAPVGTLTAFSVGSDGLLTGQWTNGLSQPIGQIALATFANNEGLVDQGENLFQPGPNSGPAGITTAGTLGAGSVVGGALELSNVELGEEFIRLIQSSTGYSANSRVIRTTDELMQQLLALGR